MSTAAVVCLAVSALIILALRKPSRIIYAKNLLIPALSIIFILLLMIFSKTALNAASRGINLWLNIVFPSLFPFFVASEILNRTGFVRLSGAFLEPVMKPLFNVPGAGAFAFAMGVTSGYPVGAKITADMRAEELLTKVEAERLLTFTNNSGPLFIIGAVSAGMLKIPSAGFLLLGCHILACVTVGLLFRFYRRKDSGGASVKQLKFKVRVRKELAGFRGRQGERFGSMLGNAVKNSVMTVLSIGGFIIFFSVVISLLVQTGIIEKVSNFLFVALFNFGIKKSTINALLCGFFEITTGCSTAAKSSDASFIQQLAALSMIIGWAGLSVHSQVASIVSRTDISVKPYFLGKFLQGIIACAYTLIAGKLMGLFNSEPVMVFSPATAASGLNWSSSLLLSLKYLLICFGVFGAGMLLHRAYCRIGPRKGRSGPTAKNRL